jgi:hypothetical protein
MAVWGQLAADLAAVNTSERLTKMTGTGEFTTVMHIAWFDPECI